MSLVVVIARTAMMVSCSSCYSMIATSEEVVMDLQRKRSIKSSVKLLLIYVWRDKWRLLIPVITYLLTLWFALQVAQYPLQQPDKSGRCFGGNTKVFFNETLQKYFSDELTNFPFQEFACFVEWDWGSFIVLTILFFGGLAIYCTLAIHRSMETENNLQRLPYTNPATKTELDDITYLPCWTVFLMIAIILLLSISFSSHILFKLWLFR